MTLSLTDSLVVFGSLRDFRCRYTAKVVGTSSPNAEGQVTYKVKYADGSKFENVPSSHLRSRKSKKKKKKKSSPTADSTSPTNSFASSVESP